VTRTVFVATSPLHLIFSAAICETLPIDGPEVHWFGPAASVHDRRITGVLGDLPLVDCSSYEINSFGGFLRNGGRYVRDVVDAGPRVSRVFTCYETHVAVDAIRHRHRVPWADVGIIEDGIANYIPHAMVRRDRQAVKSALSLVRFGHRLSNPPANLGGNPKVGYVTTVSPEHVHLHPRSRAQVIDLAPATRALLLERGTVPTDAYREAGTILFMSPVFQYGRMDAPALLRYLDDVRGDSEVVGPLLVKPHPRERPEAIRDALEAAGVDDVAVGGLEPIEHGMPWLDNPVWVGSATSAMLNKHVLFPGGTRFVIRPQRGNRYLDELVTVMERVLAGHVVVRR
jgi:hypothetical protein